MAPNPPVGLPGLRCPILIVTHVGGGRNIVRRARGEPPCEHARRAAAAEDSARTPAGQTREEPCPFLQIFGSPGSDFRILAVPVTPLQNITAGGTRTRNICGHAKTKPFNSTRADMTEHNPMNQSDPSFQPEHLFNHPLIPNNGVKWGIPKTMHPDRIVALHWPKKCPISIC